MLNLDYRYYLLPLEEKKRFVASIDDKNLSILRDYKLALAVNYGLRAESYDTEIAKIGDAIAMAYRTGNDMERARLEAELSKYNKEKLLYRNEAQLLHLEACMCFIEEMRRKGLTEADLSPEQLENFPATTWTDVEDFLISERVYELHGIQSSRG